MQSLTPTGNQMLSLKINAGGFLGVEAQRGLPIDISLSLLLLNH